METLQNKQQRPGGRSAQVREKVLAATLEVLVSGGVSSLTVEAIAKQSGVHKTTIYRRWGDCGALVKEAVAEQENSIAAIPNTGTLKTDLQALAEAYGDYFSNPASVAIGRLIVAQRENDHELGQWMDEYWRSRTNLYEEILQRAVDRGELHNTDATKIVLELLIGPVVMRVLLTHQPLEREFLMQVAESVHAYLLSLSGSE